MQEKVIAQRSTEIGKSLDKGFKELKIKEYNAQLDGNDDNKQGAAMDAGTMQFAAVADSLSIPFNFGSTPTSTPTNTPSHDRKKATGDGDSDSEIVAHEV